MARRPGGEAAMRVRLAAAPGLNAAEAHTLAGLLDAESHLAITPNNSGADLEMRVLGGTPRRRSGNSLGVLQTNWALDT